MTRLLGVRHIHTTFGTVDTRRVIHIGWLVVSLVLLSDPRIRSLAFLPNDWQVWTWVPGWIESGELYDPDHWIVWSPPMMWLIAYGIVPLGYGAWWAAHLLSLLTLPRTVALLVVLSVPFWMDAMNGQTVVFQFVAGWFALRGSRVGIVAFVVLAVLIPRPLVLPLLAWLLWKEPWSRWPFVVSAALVVGVSAWSGDLLPWIRNMLAIGRDNHSHFANLSPTRVIGGAWLVIGVPLAVALTYYGKVGWAGLALSPYLLPNYLLAVLWSDRR